jgi:hypothetical protein
MSAFKAASDTVSPSTKSMARTLPLVRRALKSWFGSISWAPFGPALRTIPRNRESISPRQSAALLMMAGDRVGFQAGTYRTRTPSSNCYWERLSGFSGATSDIIANDNTDAPSVVTIKKSDAGFSSSSCAPWVTDLSAITASRTTFGDGTYIVKTDLDPGTYKSSGGLGCYWERLSGFGGTSAEILANNNVDGPTIVTVEASDAGFSSHSCGTWASER